MRRCGCRHRPDPQARALPQRVVHILHRQRRPIRRPPRAPAGIGHPQISHQRPHRPTIGGDMVHHRHQHVLVIADTEKPCPQWNLGARSKLWRATVSMATSSRPADQPVASTTCQPKSAPSTGITTCWGIPSGATNSVRRLSWRAHHIGQRPAQRVGIKAPAQPQRHRHVVNRRRPLQLVKEPQPALAERQWNHRGPLLRRQRLTPT